MGAAVTMTRRGGLPPGRTALKGLACLAAAGLVALAYTHGHRQAAPSWSPQAGKALDRLAFVVEDVPVRATLTFDAVAMFARPMVEPQPWSEAATRIAAAAPPVQPAPVARLLRPEPERRVAAVPPSRPRELAPAMPAISTLAVARPPETGRQPIALFGISLPGSEYLPRIPTPRETVRHVASMRDAVLSIGDAIGETVGLR